MMKRIFSIISFVLCGVSFVLMFFIKEYSKLFAFGFILFAIIGFALYLFDKSSYEKKSYPSTKEHNNVSVQKKVFMNNIETYKQKKVTSVNERVCYRNYNMQRDYEFIKNRCSKKGLLNSLLVVLGQVEIKKNQKLISEIKSIDDSFQNQKNEINIKRDEIRTYKIVLSVFLLLLFAVLAFSATYLINLAFCKEKPYIERTTEYRLVTKTRRVLKTNSACYITEYGECFHKNNCAYLTNNAEKTTMVEASNKGYRPCSRCWPNPAVLFKDETYEEEEPITIETERTKTVNYYPQIAIPVSFVLIVFFLIVNGYVSSSVSFIFKEKYDKQEKEAYNNAKNKINTIINNNPTINTDEIQSIIQKYASP